MRVLLIDTCGDVGCVALAEGECVLSSERLPAREASATLLLVISRLLAGKRWALKDLNGIGVMNGPGSFTGIRVGIAAAKGLCETSGLPLVAVSRLEALANASSLQEGCAVLDAGRGEFYARTVDGHERVITKDALRRMVCSRIVVAEDRAMEALAAIYPEKYEIKMEHFLPMVCQSLHSGEVYSSWVDANYVRMEKEIYPTAPARGDAV